jgi:hypothetical protein
MIIDTYVYFVSYYDYGIGSRGVIGYGNAEVTLKNKIKRYGETGLFIKKLKEYDECDETTISCDPVILNFILLDSYNKEEREAKEQKKKDAV